MLRVATRASRLARWQADHVVALLGVDCELVPISTEGDRRQDVEIHQMGGQGVFVKEIQYAVLDGRADVAVHSAKDLPSAQTDGLSIAAIPERGDPRDALVGSKLAALRPGASVGTGSVRRRAQLAAVRPDLTFGPLRGNIETRLGKADQFDAIVVAAVALERLELAHRIAEILDPQTMLPQVGQGALAVECRADDDTTRAVLAVLDHVPSRAAVEAERAYLAGIGGACDVPCAAYATLSGTTVALDALLADLDGSVVVRSRATGDEPVAVGRRAAQDVLAHPDSVRLLETSP